MVKPGHAVWKFVYHDGKVFYERSNKGAVAKLYRNIASNFSVYVRSPKGGWEYVASNIVTDRCQCGRLYTDTFNGLEFRWRDNMFTAETTVEDCKKIFQAQDLCQVCYYKGELEAGRFCPKWVKQQLIGP